MSLALHQFDAGWEWFLSLHVGKARNKVQMFHLFHKCQFDKTLIEAQQSEVTYLSNATYIKKLVNFN